MSDIVEFLSAVFDSWVTSAGILLTVIPFVEKVPSVKKQLNDKPMLEKFGTRLWIIGLLCLFGGFYYAWREQKDTVASLKEQLGNLQKEFDSKDVPNLSLQIDGLAVGDSELAIGPKGQKVPIN